MLVLRNVGCGMQEGCGLHPCWFWRAGSADAGGGHDRGKGAQSIGSVSEEKPKPMTGAYESVWLGKVQRLPGT
ncbi:hypothetical protein BGW80DRAFT_1282090, partial [Lactifluus volemus]